MRHLRVSVLTVILSLLCAVTAYAAISGVISGTVTDPNGAVVPNATIVATDVATGVKHTTTTDGKGFYSFPALDIGDYDVTGTMNGFSTFEIKGLHVDANSSMRADMTLKVGAEANTVEVTSNPVEVETQSSQVSNVMESEQMTAVPLNGRAFTDLLNLQPGVGPTQSVESSDTPKPSGSLDVGSVSVNGGRGASNGFMINGGNTNDGVDNSAAIVPNLDSIQEFRIITSNFDAEYGNYSGSQINVVTKNGTNKWHGSGFEFLRNTIFNARGYTFSVDPLPRSSYNQNIYGGTFGGPIKKDKIFFFADFQGTNRNIAASSSTVVPSAADLTGNLSDWDPQWQNSIANSLGVVEGTGWAGVLSKRLGYTVTDQEPYVYDTDSNGNLVKCTNNNPNSATGCVFPNETIPKAAWDPVVSHLLSYIPAPN